MKKGWWRKKYVSGLGRLHRLLAQPLDAVELGRSALVVAPHPDDETLACGGLMALKSRAGARLTVAILSDGSRSHARRMDPARLPVVRRAECLSALEVLGVSPDRAHFLDVPDQLLEENRPEITLRLCSLLDEECPEEIWLPCAEEPSSDHQAANRAARDALQQSGRRIDIYEYPVWLWCRWPFIGIPLRLRRRSFRMLGESLRIGFGLRLVFGFRHSADIRAVLELKREALLRYETQMVRPPSDPNWPILADVAGGDFLSLFFQDREFFRFRGHPFAMSHGREVEKDKMV